MRGTGRSGQRGLRLAAVLVAAGVLLAGFDYMVSVGLWHEPVLCGSAGVDFIVAGGSAPRRSAGAYAAAPGQAADRPVIGVADFYSPGAVPIFVLLDPEQYTADVSAGLLIRRGGQAITVLPRGEVRGAERTLGWRTHDALNFSRLRALADAIHADRLLVGWIGQIAVFRQDFALFSASATVTTQVFDALQGRIVWQRETYGSGLAGLPDFALELALDRAAARGVDAAIHAVSAPVDRTAPQP